MATDQGKNSNVIGLAVMAEATGRSIEETGTTIFRPPYNPVPIGAFAGRSRDKDFRPVRLTPSHKWAEENGAVFIETGQWLRAQYFPRNGESHWRQSVDREVLQTRSSVGICDVSTLGKIDIQGKDSVEFINRVYSNGFAKLPALPGSSMLFPELLRVSAPTPLPVHCQPQFLRNIAPGFFYPLSLL